MAGVFGCKIRSGNFNLFLGFCFGFVFWEFCEYARISYRLAVQNT